MAYTTDKKSTGLDTLTQATLTQSDLHIVGDVSDSGRAKAITENELEDYIANSTNFVDELVSNNYFTTELAGDTNFITNLQTAGIGSTIDVQENGVSVENPVDTINFVAPTGTVTTPSAGVVDIDLISLMGGGGGGANLLYDAWDDFLSGKSDDDNEVIADRPDISGSNTHSTSQTIGSLNWFGWSNTLNEYIAKYKDSEEDHPGVLLIGNNAAGTNHSCIQLGGYESNATPINTIDKIMRDGNKYTFIVNPISDNTGSSDLVLGITEEKPSDSISSDNSIKVIFDASAGNIVFYTSSSPSGTQTTTIGTYTLNTWYKIEFKISGSSVLCYIDDVLVATHTTVPTVTAKGNPFVYAVNDGLIAIDFFGMKYGRELSGSGIQTKTVSISSSDILNIHTTPKELIPAPGAGKVIIVQSAVFSFTVGSTQYSNGNRLVVSYSSNASSVFGNQTNTLLLETLINGSASFVTARSSQDGAMPLSQVNESIVLTQDTPTAFTSGDGTLKVFITYQIITL